MPDSPNKLAQFWQELKRRKVVRVITVYAATTFVILELLSIIIEPLKLPDWTLQFAIVFLCIGFVIAVILSWIYDIHPEGGIVKTEPAHKAREVEKPDPSKSWKIASYISFVVIIGLVTVNIIVGTRGLRPGDIQSLVILPFPDKSIAVLPFINDSPDEENAYFINGTMEAILDNLCKIEDLRVVGRTSVEQYRNAPKPIPVIAEEMNVSYILEGSGQKDGNKVRLTLQLIDGINDQHLWSSPYIREIEMGKIFDLQSEIAELVAGEIKAVITPEEKQLIEKIPTASQTAYDLYQKAVQEHQKFNSDTANTDGLDNATELYYYALEYDSAFALPYVALAWIFWDKLQGNTNLFGQFEDSVMILTDKALYHDSQLASAYNLKGCLYGYQGKPDKAIAAFDRAIDLNPNLGSAYSGKGWLYFTSGNYLNVIKNFQQSTLRDRRSENLIQQYRALGFVFAYTGFGEIANHYYKKVLKQSADSAWYIMLKAQLEEYSGNHSKAIELALKGYEMAPDNNYFLIILGENYLFTGQFKESLKYFEEYVEFLDTKGTDTPWHKTSIACSYLKNRNREKADYFIEQQIRQAEDFIENRRSGYIERYYYLAMAYALKGDKDRTIENLRLFNQHDSMNILVMRFRTDPRFSTIKDDPEFLLICDELEAKYQAEHERIKQWLEENDMI